MLQHRAVYPGSFDPMTFGHLDVVARARRLFDELVVAVGFNPGKSQLFSIEERVAMARRLIEEHEQPNERASSAPGAATRCPVRVEAYRGLTVDFAKHVGATAIIRGVRNMSDLQNEVQQALTNREVAGLETVFVVAGPSFAYTSSSLIRQIAALGTDRAALASMVPAAVIEQLWKKKQERHPLLESLRQAASGDAAK